MPLTLCLFFSGNHTVLRPHMLFIRMCCDIYYTFECDTIKELYSASTCRLTYAPPVFVL